MIPARNLSGVLPPFTGKSPADAVGASPYQASILEFAQNFCSTGTRVQIFRGLLEYRRVLRNIGLSGRQWLDGSFCEDVERIHRRVPRDVDVVNLIAPPSGTPMLSLMAQYPKLFNWTATKAEYHCDAYSVEISLPAALTYRQLVYYFGLFSHQRATFLWKGMVEVPLASDDDQATAYINTVAVSP